MCNEKCTVSFSNPSKVDDIVKVCRKEKLSKKEDYVIAKYDVDKYHLKDKADSERVYKSAKGENISRTLNTNRFNLYKWGTFRHGLLQCGLCAKAKELGCQLWLSGNKTNQDLWIDGTQDWKNYSGPKKWEQHDKSDTHRIVVEFLYDRNHHNVVTEIDQHRKGNLKQCQERNRIFLGKGVITCVKFLARRGLPLFGNSYGDGMLPDLLHFIGKEYEPMIQKHLLSTKKDRNLVRAMHSTDINFVLNRFITQILEVQFEKLNRCNYICIIADEWSNKVPQEYCSVSARFVMDDLEVGISFLGYIRIENTSAAVVTNAIIKAFEAGHIQLNLKKKVIAQTYDGASNMQGHLSGVQKRIRDEHAPYGVPIHCNNHVVQLSVKANNKGHNLISRITDNCLIIVKVIKYSPKRSEMLKKVQKEIQDSVTDPKTYYTTLRSKILDFCVTRWTVRAKSLNNILKNYVALVTLFAKIMSEQSERSALNQEKTREITGLIKYLQTYEFFFGMKLCITLYATVDSYSTKLQGDNVNISVAIHYANKLVQELEAKRDNFEDFWTEVNDERKDVNNLVSLNEILNKYSLYDGIEEPKCPRASIKVVREATGSNEDAAKAYWKELYLDGFETILEDLRDRLNSPQLQLCAEIEELLLNGIVAPNGELKTDIIKRDYTSIHGDKNAPLEVKSLYSENLKLELTYLREAWQESNKTEPETFQQISDMMRKSFKDKKPLRVWKVHAPTIITLVQIIRATAGTSAFAERTFSLARRLKNWNRLSMDDKLFNSLGLMAWYKDDLDAILDLINVGNEYIDICKNDIRAINYGGKFSKEDFITIGRDI